MKRFFINGTEDEVKFGDYLELDLVDKKGTTHKHMECKFIPEILDFLVEEGVIEKRDSKKKCGKCSNKEELLDILLETNAILTERIEALEKKVYGK